MNDLQKILHNMLSKNVIASGDRDFCTSLSQALKPSEKQMIWVDKMIVKYSAPKAEPQPEPTMAGAVNLAAIVAFFTTAAETLKKPRVRLVKTWRAETLTDKEEARRHNIILKWNTPEESPRYANTLAIFDNLTHRLLGNVDKDGVIMLRTSDNRKELLELLLDFAKDPSDLAALHGKLTGNCCFCWAELDDPRSTLVGYGPICAKRYHLRWGISKTELDNAKAEARKEMMAERVGDEVYEECDYLPGDMIPEFYYA